MPSDQAPVRLAVVGVGAIGRRHIDYMQGRADFAVVAAADPMAGTSAFLRAHQIPHFDDYRAMLDAVRLDGVVVATPNSLHEAVAIACLDRGIPVLIEKPIAHSLESASAICAAVDRTGVPALVGHHRRHNPLMRAARDFIGSGALGALVAVAAVDFRRKPDAYYDVAWRREPGGGPMLINGIHDIDCLRALCGEIESVMAMTSNRTRGFEVEDSAAITLRFENGAIGTLTVSDAVQAPWAWEIVSGEEEDYPHQREDCYVVTGTEGALALPTLTHWRNERGGGRADPFIRTQLFYKAANPWVEELLHFAAVVRGDAAPLVTVVDGARTLAAVLAVARSAATGHPVTIGEMLA